MAPTMTSLAVLAALVVGASADPWALTAATKSGSFQFSEDSLKGKPTVAWFVSFAPAAAPQVAVAVLVEDAGAEEVSGNGLAAPIAKDVMEAVLERR